MYEGFQDRLTQIKDARAALDALREEEIERKRREQEELERQRQIQLAAKLEVMRKKKAEYLEYQREAEARKKAEAAARAEAGEEDGEELGGDEKPAGPLDMTIEEAQAAFPVGSRCEADPGARRGEVCYVGPASSATK